VDEKSYSAVYLYAICTAPEQRKRGFMRRLVEFALAELKKQGIAVVFLSPQEEYLVAVYEKFGFWRAFVSKLEKLLPLLLSAPDAEEAYRYYAEFYHNKNHIKLSRTQFDFLYRELRYHHSNPPEKALALILNNEKLSWITIENTQLGLIDD
jgi:predicted acetyltransferase